MSVLTYIRHKTMDHNQYVMDHKGPLTNYVITFCLFLNLLPPSVIKFGIGCAKMTLA